MSHNTMYNTTVYMGRFQPLHLGHLNCIHESINSTTDQAVIILGSANQATNESNPLTDEERLQVLVQAIEDSGEYNVESYDYYSEGYYNVYNYTVGCTVKLYIKLVEDYYYDVDKWVDAVKSVCNFSGAIAQVGHRKDVDADVVDHHTELFPDWGYIDVGLQHLSGSTVHFSSSELRHHLYTKGCIPTKYLSNLPSASIKAILKWRASPKFLEHQSEHLYLQEYPILWGKGPFDASDAIVLHNSNVLLIKRGGQPGRGLMALPGGFKEPLETNTECALRELVEETNLAVSKRYIIGSHTFNRGSRSKRNVVSNTVLIRLPNDFDVSEVVAGDDACEALWVPLDKLDEMKTTMFSDHLHIINYMLDNYS